MCCYQPQRFSLAIWLPAVSWSRSRYLNIGLNEGRGHFCRIQENARTVNSRMTLSFVGGAPLVQHVALIAPRSAQEVRRKFSGHGYLVTSPFRAIGPTLVTETGPYNIGVCSVLGPSSGEVFPTDVIASSLPCVPKRLALRFLNSEVHQRGSQHGAPFLQTFFVTSWGPGETFGQQQGRPGIHDSHHA